MATTHAQECSTPDWLLSRLAGAVAAHVVSVALTFAACLSRITGYTRKTFRPPRDRWEAVKSSASVCIVFRLAVSLSVSIGHREQQSRAEQSTAEQSRAEQAGDALCVDRAIRMH